MKTSLLDRSVNPAPAPSRATDATAAPRFLRLRAALAVATVLAAPAGFAQPGGGYALNLRSEITGSGPAGGVTVTHTVWNSGDALAPGVWLTNRLPTGISFIGTNKWPFPGGTSPTYPPPPDPPLLLTTIASGTTFGPATLATNPPAVAIAITDVNKDGWPDLVIPHGTNAPGLSLYLGNPTNLPSVPTTLPTPVPPATNNLRTVSIGDFNGDGLPDLVAADASVGNLRWYLQTGPTPAGTNFTTGPTRDFPTPITDIAVMDFDGDGFDDVAVLEPAAATIHLLLNTTAHTGVPDFMEAGQLPTPPAPTALGKEKKRPGRESPTLASLGRLYVTSDSNGGTLTVFVPSGSSDPSNLYLPGADYACGPTPRAIGVADLDGDGLDDLVVANGPARTVTLLKADALAGYHDAGGLPSGVITSVNALQLLDLDGDGRPEIITGSTGVGDLVVIPNSRLPLPLSPMQFLAPVHFDLPAPLRNLGYDAYRDGSQAGGFVAVGHTGPGGGALAGGRSFSLLTLTQPGAEIGIPLGDLPPGAASGISLELEVRIPDATNSTLARTIVVGGGGGVGPIPDPIPLRSICGKLYCVAGGVTQGMGGFAVTISINGTGYSYTNTSVTLADGTYCMELPFECGGIFPWDTVITVTSAGCPGQVATVPLWTYFQTATIPAIYCGNCNACTNVQQVLNLFSGAQPAGLLPIGSLDPQFSTGNPPFANSNPYVTGADTGWLPDGPTSQWIGPDVMFMSFAGVYCYTNTFYLPCTNSASLHGRWTLAGEGGEVLLNGVPTAISLAGFGLETSWHPFNLTSGFIAGLNTLVFCVTNPPSSVGLPFSPTGLRTEITGTAHCCAGCVEIRCPTNQVVEICTNGPAPYGAVVNYPMPAAISHCGYITNLVCVPPPGSFFPVGTNLVVCTTTDSLGNTASCTFKVIVLPDFTPPIVIQCPPFNVNVTGCPPILPWLTNGLVAVDNCSGPGQLSVTQFPPAGTPLPGGQTTVIVRVCDAAGNCRDCDVIVEAVPTGGMPEITCPPPLTLLTCSNSAIGNFTVATVNATGVTCTPPPGSAFPLGTTWVTCMATNICGGSATCFFPVTVQRPPWRFACLQVGIGIPFEPIGGATYSFSASSLTPETPTLNIIPALGSATSGIRLEPGLARTIRFTTVLDFTAPVGAGFDLHLPPGPGNPNDPPIVSFRNKGPKGYCVKMNKRFADLPGEMRSYAVNTNGDLMGPITFTSAEVDAIGVCDIGFQPGVTNCHVTIEVNLVDGSTSVEFDGPVVPVVPTADRHKGWDGCIYGPDRPRPKPPKASRVILIPPPLPPGPPVTEAFLYVSGWAHMPIEDPSLSTQSANGPRRRWGDGHVTLMKAYDEERVAFAVTSTGGGVAVDLGHANSFELSLQKFGTNPPPGEQLLTRTLGPIRGLTNRPPPPFLDAMLFEATDEGVACSADFTNLESPTVRVQVWLEGALVTQRTGVPAHLGDPLFTLSGWPERIGKLGGSTPCRTVKRPPSAIILPGGGGLPPQVVLGDECRVLAETPPGTPHPDLYSGFEFSGSDGADWGVRLLETTPAFGPIPLTITPSSDGYSVMWQNADFKLQGATDITGPWFDLGVASPLALPASHPARYYRLVSE
jgi:hypothetical protein